MKIDVYFTPLGLKEDDLAGRGAVNFPALAERARALFTERSDLAIVCAGRDKQFALEDAYTAGRLIKAVKKGVPPKKLQLNDAAQVSLALTVRYKNWRDALEKCDAARQLAEVDLAADVAFSAKADRFAVVPVYADRRIT